MEEKGFWKSVDSAGFLASALCAIHCVGLPILLTLGSLSSFQVLDHPLVEWGMLLLSFSIASYSLLPSYFKEHQRLHALAMVVLGFTMIFVGELMEHELGEILLASLGGFTVAAAHLVNWKLLRTVKVQ